MIFSADASMVKFDFFYRSVDNVRHSLSLILRSPSFQVASHNFHDVFKSKSNGDMKYRDCSFNEYSGGINHTKTGIQCKVWSSQKSNRRQVELFDHYQSKHNVFGLFKYTRISICASFCVVFFHSNTVPCHDFNL